MQTVRFWLILVIVALALGVPTQVFAQSGADINRSYDGLVWAPDGFQSACLSGVFVGGNNVEVTWNYFRDKGLTEEQTAGIIGNLMWESGLDPTKEQNGGGPGRGIAQWTVTERWVTLLDYAAAQNRDPLTLDLQLDFIWFEMTGEPSAPGVTGGYESRSYEGLIETTTVEEATRAFEELYERAGVEAINQRINLANQAYAQFSGTNISGATVGTACGAVGIGPDGFVFPIKGSQSEISWCGNSFGNCHGTHWAGTYYAYDIFGPHRGSIVAVRDGYIRGFNPDFRCTAGPQLSFWLEDDEGFWYFYQHLDATLLIINEGERVTAGQELGVIGPNAYVGGTCSDSVPHLHFAASTQRTSMFRGCTESQCPNADKLIDVADILKAAYDNLPQ